MDSPTGAGGAFRHRVEYEGRTPALRLPLRRSRWAPLATLGLLALPLFHLAQWRHDWTWSIAAIGPACESLAALFIIAAFLSQIFAAETLRVFDGHLEIGMSVGPIGRTWRYRIDRIRELHVDEEADTHKGRGPILLLRPDKGAVSFRYDGKEVHAAPGAGGVEGEAIVAWLASRLPRAAVQLA